MLRQQKSSESLLKALEQILELFLDMLKLMLMNGDYIENILKNIGKAE